MEPLGLSNSNVPGAAGPRKPIVQAILAGRSALGRAITSMPLAPASVFGEPYPNPQDSRTKWHTPEILLTTDTTQCELRL